MTKSISNSSTHSSTYRVTNGAPENLTNVDSALGALHVEYTEFRGTRFGNDDTVRLDVFRHLVTEIVVRDFVGAVINRSRSYFTS